LVGVVVVFFKGCQLPGRYRVFVTVFVTSVAIKFYSFSGNSNNVSVCVETHLGNFVNFILARSFLKEVEQDISLVHEHIIRTLLYYDIFNYPLKAEEVFRFLGTSHANQRFVRKELEHLANQQLISASEIFSPSKTTKTTLCGG
jgi:tRNA U34 5-methylaminomethyl-2-thiouridine-forming methyltransferase MnmC